MDIYTGELPPTRTYDDYRGWVLIEDAAGLRLTVIQEGQGRSDVTSYTVREVSTLRGMRKFRLDGGKTGTHHVTIGGPRPTCTCRGFHRAQHCKHLDTIRSASMSGGLDGGHDLDAMTAAWGPGTGNKSGNFVD